MCAASIQVPPSLPLLLYAISAALIANLPSLLDAVWLLHLLSCHPNRHTVSVVFSWQRASKAISRKSSAMDGHLFLIKHLLVLREQVKKTEGGRCLVGNRAGIGRLGFRV